jgi:hypothetical protein
MNEVARKVLQGEKDRWVMFRKEKYDQVVKLTSQLADAKRNLEEYDCYITALQEALEND